MMNKDRKTEQEIKEWLETRRWFKKFKRNLEKQAKLNPELQETVDNILEGRYGHSTISAAFKWENTPEGLGYWARRNIEFIRWFDYDVSIEVKEEERVPKFWLFIGIVVCGLSFLISASEGECTISIVSFICFFWLAFASIGFLKNE